MKKTFAFLVVLFLFFLTACNPGAEPIVSETQETSTTQAEVVAPDESNLVMEHKNFRWYKENWGVESTFVIYDNHGKAFHRETNGYKSFKSDFSFVGSDILQARWSGGSYTSVHQFYNIDSGLISPEYLNVIVGYGKAAYLEYGENSEEYQLVVQDLFAQGKFKQVYKRAIGFRGLDYGCHGVFLDENRLLLEYAMLKEEPHPFFIACEIIDLTAPTKKKAKLLPFVTPEAILGANILERGTNYLCCKQAENEKDSYFTVFYDVGGKEIHRINPVNGAGSVSVVGENLLRCDTYRDGERVVQFINFRIGQISPEIKAAGAGYPDILIRSGKIAYINEKNQIVVQDMFDPAKFYQAFDMQEETTVEFWVDDSHIQVMCHKEVESGNPGQLTTYWNEVLEIAG